MEFIYTKESKQKKLTESQKSEISSDIKKSFTAWNQERQPQIDDAKLVQNAVFAKKDVKNDDWKSNIKSMDIYELAQTLKAHIFENVYKNADAMFDVSGRDKQSEEVAPIQKAQLVNALEEMEYKPQIEDSVNNLVEMGEGFIFVGWRTQKKQVRRQVDSVDELGNPIEEIVIQDITAYDNAYMKSIDPMHLVYDVNKKDNWLSCPKIYQYYLTYDEIQSNKLFSATKDELKKLENTGSKTDDNKSITDINEKNDDLNENKKDQIKILEFWGDYKLKDGTMLRNWLITVADDVIIRFEQNPYVTCPFTPPCVLIEDPNTKRGISPLRIALMTSEINETIINKQLDALALMMNPPYLAPKGGFKGSQEVKPGKIIEYDATLMSTTPTPLNFDKALRGWDFINYFKDMTANATGIFKNMAGDVERQQKTATELNYTANGQTTRLSMIVDKINHTLIIKSVELVAELIANYKFGEENVLSKGSNGNQFVSVTDEIRQGNYKYSYGDGKAKQARKLRFQELAGVIEKFGQSPIAGDIDWMECFKYALEQNDVENTDRFILTPEEKIQRGMMNVNQSAEITGNPTVPMAPNGSLQRI